MKKILFVLLFLFILVGCKDKTPPEISLNPGIDTIEVGEEWIDGGCVVVDDKDDSVACTVESNNININTVGEYEVVYKAIDSIENEKSITRKVTVVDETKPILSLNAGVDTIIIGNEWIDAGVTVTDNYDANLSYTVNGSVNINVVGEYTITYTATDSSGNTSTIIRYVNVVE